MNGTGPAVVLVDGALCSRDHRPGPGDGRRGQPLDDADRSRRDRRAPAARLTPPVQGTAYFPTIEERYGRPVSHGQEVLRAHRAEHGMRHGHATALVAATPPDTGTGTRDGRAAR
jgi:hypothetical protein